ncbi:hypothetical protein [Candidatus Enterococcus clewellii]|uniref:ABC-2 type transporter domain-containing protein n=1 Tax=Candidatus Enterococcus clewellii TaxID=1834193 RepID=A0A242K4H0_9ENTE|nr:hypothetical protein [Enterococcus sp. 9E7_DIV0242]OTP14427.1 hypothetical protein A5888_002528 [Enterococcus sp. 9E7_DIV0242]
MKTVALIKGDIRFQLKYGFYYLYLFFMLLYIFFLLLFPVEWRQTVGVIMIYSDPAALGLFFMGAIVLLEKNQQVLNALTVAPISGYNYLLGKASSIGLISVAVSIVLGYTAKLDRLLVLLATTALLSIIFTFLGFIVAARITTLNQYLLWTIPFQLICFVAPIVHVFYPIKFLTWYPFCQATALLSGEGNIVATLLILSLFCLLLFVFATKTFNRMKRTLGGGL